MPTPRQNRSDRSRRRDRRKKPLRRGGWVISVLGFAGAACVLFLWVLLTISQTPYFQLNFG